MKPNPPDEPLILTVRDQRVILDADLARIYGVPTFRFNEAVKRNRKRFPNDFAFQLTTAEWRNLKSQIAISSSQTAGDEADALSLSQTAMSSHGGRRKLPWVFTEHGALMAANVLRSARAVEMSVYVVRAFVRQREQLSVNTEVLRRLGEIDRKLLQHDGSIIGVLNLIKALVTPSPSPPPPPPKPRIGFKP